MGESLAIGAVVIVLLIYILLMAFLIVNYVFQSLSLHTLARRRGIANPWLAWVPFGNYWIIGALARDHDKQNGISRRWDKTLLTLSIVGSATFIATYIALIVYVIAKAASLESSGITYGEDMAVEMLGGILIIYVFLIAAVIVMSAVTALTYICLFKIFESTVPEKALKFFLIHLLVPFAAPFCLFACRNQGYQHPDPMAYIYNPVDKDYNYYHNPVVEPETRQATTEETDDSNK